MRRIKRSRWLCLLAGVLLAVSLLTGCGRSGAQTVQEENASTLISISESGQELSEAGTGQSESPPEDTEQPPGTPEQLADGAEHPPEAVEPPPEAAGKPPEASAQTPEQAGPENEPAEGPEEAAPAIDEDGSYTTKEDVALYIHTYGRLPSNFITKKQAEKLGWSGGSLEPYAPGKCIGGSRFGNYEKLLPDGNYKECDIDTLGKKSRGAKRLIYSDDGRIYYTGDHYKSFTQLY